MRKSKLEASLVIMALPFARTHKAYLTYSYFIDFQVCIIYSEYCIQYRVLSKLARETAGAFLRPGYAVQRRMTVAVMQRS